MEGPGVWIVLLIILVAALAGAIFGLDRARRWCARPTWSGLLVWTAMRLYARLLHRLRIEGREHIPAQRPPLASGQWPGMRAACGPLIIVANHTCGIDPILLQAALPIEPRWMMTRAMDVGIVRWFTRYGQIILVDPNGRDLSPTREALRHLRDEAVLGIFPEGGIERPPNVLRRFHEGVGLLVGRSGANVLPAWISGTPRAETALDSIWRFSRARIVFGPLMEFDRNAEPTAIAAAIRDEIARLSGWPAVDVPADEPLPKVETADAHG